MSRGYIKLHRKLLDSRVFRNPELLKVWVWCLLKANHGAGWTSIKSGRSTVQVRLEPGEFVMGRRSAAKELGMVSSTVWKRLLKLQELGNILIRSSRNHSVVSVVNWQDYQGVTLAKVATELPQSVAAKRAANAGQNEVESQQVIEGEASKVDRKADRKVGPLLKNVRKTLCPKPAVPDEALRLSDLLASLILANNPKSVQLRNGKRADTVRRWASDIDKLHRLDGQSFADVEKVIRWSQADGFWSKNILSGATLRKQWDRLLPHVESERPQAQDWRTRYAEAPD